MLLINTNPLLPILLKMSANQLQNMEKTIMKSNPSNLTKTQQRLKKVNLTTQHTQQQKTISTGKNISLIILNRRKISPRRKINMKRFASTKTWVFCHLTLRQHSLEPSQLFPNIVRNPDIPRNLACLKTSWPEEETGLLQV